MFSKTAGEKNRIRQLLYRQRLEEVKQRQDRYLFGSLGPASPVRRIDPKTGSVIELIEK